MTAAGRTEVFVTVDANVRIGVDTPNATVLPYAISEGCDSK